MNPHRWLADARGRELVRTAGTVLIVSAAYYLGARLGLVLKFAAITPSVLWPPNAILTAVLLLAPPRRWWIYLLAALPAHLIVEMQAHWPTPLVLVLFITNCGEALVAATLVRSFSGGEATFNTLRGVVVFIICAGFVAPFVSTFPDAAAMARFRGEDYWLDWRTRFLDNTLAELTVAPVIFMALRTGRARIRNLGHWGVLEGVWFWAGFLIVGVVVFLGAEIITGDFDVLFRIPFIFVLPFLLWAAVRMGPLGTSVGLLAVELLAIWAGARGRWSSQFPAAIVNVQSLQMVLMAIAIPLMCLAALIEERRASEAIKSAILASLTSSAAVFDRGGRVLSVSETWGHPSTDGPGRSLFRDGAGGTYAEVCRLVLPPDNPSLAERVIAGVRSVVEDFRPSFSLEYSSGIPPREHWFAISASPLQRVDGGTVLFCTDITARKRMEIETKQAWDELAHSTRVSTMGALAASLAHELNQPLGAVLSNAEAGQLLLGRDAIDGSQLEAIMHDIVADTQRAGEVIRRLRALLRKGESSLQQLDLNQVTSDVLDFAHSELITRNVTVVRQFVPSLPTVLGDRVQLQQVLLNLILNACDAMSAVPPASRTLTIGTSSGQAGAEVSISDRGNGIAPGIQDLLFEAFVTTKPQGLGLGLSICRSIITAHGGRLWAENNPDRGATFHFTLPVAPLRAV
ncbi:MAG TPA: ATP-binding protein [bacterium]|nr:ATP-binding protein [bacterium]